MAAYPKMLREDRERAGLSLGQVAWRLGLSRTEYRELEAGERSPSFETWDRICKLYGWPQTFVGSAKRGRLRLGGSVKSSSYWVGAGLRSAVRCRVFGRRFG